MPNVKIYVDEAIYPDRSAALAQALGPIRTMLCTALAVPPQACQFAVMGVLALPDQPPVNVELQIMPHPDRTRPALLAICAKLRDMLGAVTSTHVAVRLTTLNPDTYIALK
ncbi:MAG: hypothetical protein ACOH2M_02580 [Cypionkella sp.]